MKKRRTSTSSKDKVGIKNRDENAYSSLCKHSWQRCEFCDELFTNKYSILRHNINHIVIPLVKLTTYQCDECLYHFTSIEDLTMHIATKHKHIPKKDYPSVKLKHDNLKEKIPEILQSIVEKQVVVKCEDELNEVLGKRNELRNNNGMTKHDENVRQLNGMNETLTDVKEEPLSPKLLLIKRSSSVSDEEKEPIRQRLLFEEDLEDDLFQDHSVNNQVHVDTLCVQPTLDFNKPTMELPDQTNNFDLPTVSGFNLDGRSNTEIIYHNGKEAHDSATDLIEYTKPIHYDVLMKPEVCTCKRCGKHFLNRFKLLQHEPKHMIVRQKMWRSPLCCVCERYIAGNYHRLRRHMEKHHPDYDVEKQCKTYNCARCGHKYYNYLTHVRNYHEIYKCRNCENGFETLQLMNDHKCGEVQPTYEPSDVSSQTSTEYNNTMNYQDQFESFTNNLAMSSPVESGVESSVMQLCEMCFSFMKITMQKRQNYLVIGEKSELGLRQTCDKCNNKFFEVKLVKRKLVKYKEIPKPKPKHNMTNMKRLKNIQNRFKMMKKIHKF